MTSAQVEILATALGLAQGILVLMNKRCNWIVYIVQLVALIAFSYMNSLYGDLVQNGIMVGICAYAWWQWGRAESAIRYCTAIQATAVIVLTVLAVAVASVILRNTDDPLPFIDAFTTVTTFVALWLMALRKVEAWVVWLVNDIAYVVEFWMLPNQALYLLGLYIVWTALAVATLVKWNKEAKI